MLPVHFVGHLGLPPEVLTKERTTYFRNAACNKAVLLVANTGDDEEQSEPRLRGLERGLAPGDIHDKARLQRIDQASAPDGTRTNPSQEGQAE